MYLLCLPVPNMFLCTISVMLLSFNMLLLYPNVPNTFILSLNIYNVLIIPIYCVSITSQCNYYISIYLACFHYVPVTCILTCVSLSCCYVSLYILCFYSECLYYSVFIVSVYLFCCYYIKCAQYAIFPAQDRAMETQSPKPKAAS